MFRSRCATGLLALVLAASASPAAVTFTDLSETDLDAVVAEAAKSRRTVMVVITQPDWCPPCIHLDRDLLRNPEETALADLSREWVAVEIHGYEEDGETLLRRHGLKFPGTPTTLLIRLDPGDTTLREGTLLGSVVGYPPDYIDQLRRAAAGHDPIPEAEAAAEASDHPEDWIAVARLYASRGQGHQARKAYSTVMRMDAHPDVPSDSLAALRVEARWEYLTRVLQRVDKDHLRFHHLVRDFLDDNPDFEQREDYRYAMVWTELALQHTDEALPLIREWYLDPGTYEALSTFLYMAFRNPDPDIVELAIAEARAAIERYPDREGALQAALGRLLRRHGQTREAEAAFRRAVELTDPETSAYVTYKAQLEYVEKL